MPYRSRRDAHTHCIRSSVEVPGMVGFPCLFDGNGWWTDLAGTAELAQWN